jgi:hypothetical protein
MTTYSGAYIDIPMSASGDLEDVQYLFVQPAETAKYVLTATGGSGPAPLGVLQNDPRSTEGAAVRLFGTSLLECSTACGAIGYGDWLTSGSNGQGVLAAGAGSTVCAMSMGELSSGSGVLIEALIFPPSIQTILGVVDNTP